MANESWRERVLAGAFSDKDISDASSWGTCAVGELHKRLPDVVIYLGDLRLFHRGEAAPCGYPKDKLLYYYGKAFMQAVRRWDKKTAADILDAIEDRVLALKREGGKPSWTSRVS